MLSNPAKLIVAPVPIPATPVCVALVSVGKLLTVTEPLYVDDMQPVVELFIIKLKGMVPDVAPPVRLTAIDEDASAPFATAVMPVPDTL